MNVFKLPVHPAADVFPMLSNDDLAELVEDIKANGLIQPIVVKDGVLIDGRNRREACRLAGVEPRVEELNGTDPATYIIATNINRRHMTKGQRAMAVARIYPDGAVLRGKKPVINTGLSSEYIKHARTVLTWLPQVAEAVLAGTKSLSEAYAEAQTWKASQDSEVTRFARLRERAPDLAELVDDGRMRLTEAESAWATRQEDHRRQRQATLEILDWMERMAAPLEAGLKRDSFIEALSEPGDRKRARAVFTQWMHDIAGTLEDLK